ncbi:MAG: hypothetical protein ACRDQC_00845 [Gaiellales bacterium]
MSAFPPDFGPTAFEQAWASGDPGELNRVNAVQGGFENVVNQLLEAAVELCRLEGWFDGRGESVLLALRCLKEHGVIAEATRKNLAGAKELRDGTQHAYPGVAATDFHAAVTLLVASDGEFLRDVARWVRANHAPRSG